MITYDASTVPTDPPTTVTSSDGLLDVTVDEANAGALLVSHFTDATVKQARFSRTNPDGTVEAVRGGDPAYAPGGVAVAYDREAPLGQGCSWTVTPIHWDGTEGDPSAAAAATIPLDSEAAWLVSMQNPDLSRLVELAPPEERVLGFRATVTPVYGSALPVVAWDVPSPGTGTVTLRTRSKGDYTSLVALLSSGPLLMRTADEFGVPDCYMLPTDGSSTRPFNDEGWSLREIPLTYQPIDRPTTSGDDYLAIPGRSYADRLAQYATYNAVPARTYLQAVTG